MLKLCGWGRMQVCKAVCGLHQRDIVHGDLRPGNVMWFSSSFSMKLVDFARWSDKGLPTPLVLNLPYAAPEVWLTRLPTLPPLSFLPPPRALGKAKGKLGMKHLIACSSLSCPACFRYLHEVLKGFVYTSVCFSVCIVCCLLLLLESV